MTVPLVEITLTEGRSPEQLRTLISTVTHAVSDSVAAPIDSIRVVLREVPTTHFAAGDVTIAERSAQQHTAQSS
ncbi:tautomerase family protein [Intrasporangium calvum]|uniref:Tautomerase family protein n=1 Tax=Intrasporangium calvum TaxID=53358 RepID=A0ABT5GLR3_9MICO|nr:tautomerase family protein [Intrasporangium calvum]MDC5699178.1 tautomerase family protein [Intrasporangium calvum]